MRASVCLAVFSAMGAAFCAGAATVKEPEYELIAPGVGYARVENEDPPIVFHAVKADLARRAGEPHVLPRAIRVRGTETLAQLTQRLVERREPVLVAVNGDFSESEGGAVVPWGLHLERGEVLSSPGGKSAFMVDRAGRPQIAVPTARIAVRLPRAAGGAQPIEAVNRPRPAGGSGLYLYTPAWGPTAPSGVGLVSVILKGGPLMAGEQVDGQVVELTSRSVPAVGIPADGFVLTRPLAMAGDPRSLAIGSTVTLRADVAPSAVDAIGGGPRLIRAGKESVEFEAEGFAGGVVARLNATRQPRAAIGYNRARTVLIVLMVEGRAEDSRGATMSELAHLMGALGAYEAMALSGGRSAGMVVAGRMAVHAPEGQGGAAPRQIANALGLFYLPRDAR